MTSRMIETVDGEVVFDNGDPDRPEYDPDTTLPSMDEQLASVVAKLDAVEALATKADATAQEVATAIRDAGPPAR